MGKYRKEWEINKPKKPARPISRFANYVSNYHQMVAPPSRRLMQEASQTWKELGEAEKDLYVDHNDMELYNRKMADYKRTIAAMKKPPECYALFTSYYWKSRRPHRSGNQSFGEIGRQIADAWNDMEDEEQKVFRAGSTMLKALYEKEQATVLSGARQLNLNWRNIAMRQMFPILTNCEQETNVQMEGDQSTNMEVDSNDNDAEDYDDDGEDYDDDGEDYDDSDYDDDE